MLNRHSLSSIIATICGIAATCSMAADAPKVTSPPTAPLAASAASASTPDRNSPLFKTTPCAGDIAAEPGDGDPDISIRDDATLNVMFHGNRFVAAPELAAEFERLNPGQRVSWTAIPPTNTLRVLLNGPMKVAGGKTFFPDVFMGTQQLLVAFTQANTPGNNPPRKIQMRGSYSRIHGIVLIGRADDPNFTGTSASAIVKNEKVRIVLPGQQPLTHALVSVYGYDFDKSKLARMPTNPRFGVSQQRHHRSIPARILAKCEDVGFQFLQSKPYLEAAYPGKFKFVPTPISDEEAAVEESYLYTLPGSPRAKEAERFVSFMRSPEAIAILRKYHLEP